MDIPEKITLTNWKNEPSISDLQQNLDDAEIDNSIYQADVERWLENISVSGSAKPKKVKGRSNVTPKVIRKQAEWRYASLSTPFLSTPDLFNVYPVTAGDRKRAYQNALVLNKQFNTYMNKVNFIDSYVRDDVDIGTVLVEVGWVSKEGELTEEIPKYEYNSSMDQNVAQQYMQLNNLKQTNKDEYENNMNPGLDKAITLFVETGIVYIANQIGVESVTSVVEVENHPTAEICDIANIVIDPSCSGDIAKAQFIIRKSKSSLSELRKDGRYENLDSIMIESANPLASPDFEEGKDIESFSFKDEPRKQFVVHTYWGTWDINNTGIALPIVASWVDNTLIRLEENPFPFKKPPFVLVTYMPVRGSVFGEPDGELLEENQQIIGAVTRGMIDLMGRSANSQQGVKVGLLDATNKRKFRRGEDYEFNSQEDPKQGIYQHKYPDIPQSATNMIAMENADAESLSGVKAFSSGINGQSLGQNVGSGRDALDAASKREAGILLRLAQGLKEIGRMFIAMNAEWLSEEEVVRITNKNFVTVRRDDLAGNFDLELTISTPEEDNRRAEGLEFLLQTTGNNMDFTLRSMILSDIAELRKMPGLAKKIEEYRPKPDPIEQKKAELEVILLQAQIAKEEALTAKHNSEANANQYRGAKDGSQAGLNSAKASTEKAKSRNLHSDSDQKDLNYLEKHSGTEYAREVAKEDQKANNALKNTIVQSELNQNKEKKKQE
jgi:hypothetical protein